MKKRRLAAVLILCLCFCGVSVSAFFVAYAKVKPDEGTICKGIYVDSISLGGMTKEQAEQTVNGYVQSLTNRKLIINVDGSTVKTKLSDLGFQVTKNDFVEQALSFGKKGNLVKRFKEIKDVEHQQLVYNLEFTLDDQLVKSFVEEKCSGFSVAAKNASMKRKNGKMVVTAEKVGRLVKTDETVEMIKSKAMENKTADNITMDAVVIDDIPKYKAADLQQCKDLLGTYTTKYVPKANRTANLKNATSFINGQVIYPGETFSTYKTIQPITKENGYTDAPSYLSGQVVDSVGGGICQVSTTLYNAVLLSELDVVERKPHSMVVTYVKPAMDAAIAGDYKDFKFENNYDTPIYIEGYANGGLITFNIYGKETRDITNRKIQYVSEILETNNPGSDVITKDKTMPTTYKKVTQAAHIGYKACLWKIVTENGVQVSKDVINTSSYAAAPNYITVGTKEEKKDKKDKDSKTDKEVSDDSDTPDADTTDEVQNQTDPSATATPAPESSNTQATDNTQVTQ